jgi:hypothetical protein
VPEAAPQATAIAIVVEFEKSSRLKSFKNLASFVIVLCIVLVAFSATTAENTYWNQSA